MHGKNRIESKNMKEMFSRHNADGESTQIFTTSGLSQELAGLYKLTLEGTGGGQVIVEVVEYLSATSKVHINKVKHKRIIRSRGTFPP